MGMAWKCSGKYPWENARWVSGIEVVKVNIALRIYAAKWHVYAGLAILNPAAQRQIQQYSRSVTELFKLMVGRHEEELSKRVWAAREAVFGWAPSEDAVADEDGGRHPILLSEEILNQFTLGTHDPKSQEAPNSHLSLLAMVDCWAALGIKPFDHLDVAGTPVFMLWIGECSLGHHRKLINVQVLRSTCSALANVSSLRSRPACRTACSVQTT